MLRDHRHTPRRYLGNALLRRRERGRTDTGYSQPRQGPMSCEPLRDRRLSRGDVRRMTDESAPSPGPTIYPMGLSVSATFCRQLDRTAVGERSVIASVGATG